MINKNKILLLFFSLLFLTSIKSQDEYLKCKDSVTINGLQNLLKKNSGENTAYSKLGYTFFQNSKESCKECKLQYYAMFFEYLFQNGLDLSYDEQKDPPSFISIGFPPGTKSIWLERLKNNNKRYNLFRTYLSFKEKYEQEVVAQYFNQQNANLSEDIASLTKSNKSSYLESLRAVLLDKYEKKSFESEKK